MTTKSDPTRASPTPRTDAAKFWPDRAVNYGYDVVSARLAEELERELAEAKASNAHMRNAIMDAEEVCEEHGRPEGEYLAHSITALLAAERERTLELQKALQAFQDGFLNSDPAAWSDWDRSVRTELIKAKLMLDAKVVVEHYDQIIGGIERTDPSVDDFVMTVADYETLRDFANASVRQRDAWRAFATHQELCAVCANNVADCDTGSALRDAASLAERVHV